MERQTREEMNALSKEVFGASSRWQKLVRKGYSKVVTRQVEETVPAEKEGEEPKTIMVDKPVLTESGAKQLTQHFHTEESVLELMKNLKAQRDTYFAAVKKAQDDQKAAKDKQALMEKIQHQAAGSAGL
jgi:glycyl-tRNA synthetase beta subunit